MIGHEVALDLAAVRLDFELAASERAALESHLAACADCRLRVVALGDDARRIATVHVRPLAAVRADGILGSVVATSRGGHPLRLVLVAALLAVVALGAAVVGGRLLRHGPDDLSVVPPVPTATASPAESVDSSVAPSPSPAPVEPIWARVADAPALDHAAMLAVTSTSDRYVAVGCRTVASAYPDAETCAAAAWVSFDARTWSSAAVASADHARLEGVVRTPVGLVAWGRTRAGDPAPIWRSPDGLRWERSTARVGDRVSGIVWSGDALVAYVDAERVGASPSGRFWASKDGLAWTSLTARDDCAALPGGRSGTLLVAGATLVVAGLGVAADGLARGDAATSVDGRCWSLSGPIGGSIAALVPHRSGFVVVGSEDGPAAAEGDSPPPMAAWTSDDGLTFTPARLSPSAPRGWLGLVASSGDRVTAIGEVLAGGFGYEPASWTSIDGRSWTRARSTPDATVDGLDAGDCTGGPCDLYRTRILGLAARSGSLVAVGLTHLPGGGYRAVAWVADASTAIPAVRLAAGSEAITLTSDIRVRSQPRVADDSIKYLPLLAEGTFLHVLEGPVFDTGFWWYRVAPYVRVSGLDVPVGLSGGAADGWVAAAGRDGAAWIGPAPRAGCATSPCPSG